MKNQLRRLLTWFLLFSLAAGVFCMPAEAAVRTGAERAAAGKAEASGTAAGIDAFMTDSTESHTPIGADISSATWKTVGGKLRLQTSGGSYRKGFVRYNGKLYYFDSNGNLMVGFFTSGGKKYYASYVQGAKGKGQILTGLVKIGSAYYFLNPSSSPYPGAVATGFRKISGRRYYFRSDGKMVTGWFTVSGSRYYASCNKKGHLGMLLTGVQKIGNNTYRFDSNGKLLGMISSTLASNKYTHTIDISEWQGSIDFKKVRNSGVKAVIIRCGYGKFDGKLHTDKYFYQNIKNAKAAGLKVGIYFFSYAYTKQMAVEEAKYVLNLLKGYKLNLPVYFDWEYDSMDKAKAHMSKKAYRKTNWRSQITEMTRAFCSTIRQDGRRAGFYFNLAYLNSYYDLSKLNGYSTWYAYWGTNKPGSNIWAHANTIKTPTRYDLWQFTSRGRIPGIKGNVDCDLVLKSGLMQ
ncbi:MAG: hypothetical protein IKD92_08470 [Lachnospiraceae bacterium]|nr:hypothetical protein [Lachnospiraceae bacterium]